MFAGDHVLPHITPSIGFEQQPAELPLGAYLDSLKLVRGLPDRRLLPAHGPVTPSVQHVWMSCSSTTARGSGTYRRRWSGGGHGCRGRAPAAVDPARAPVR
jgi:glyoxylase-like metal-dependent hydrolase (beta-lactamase superfamily II)